MENKIGRTQSAHGMRNAYKILVQKPEGKIHLEDLSADGGDIRMHLRETG
jgi:hypothetical protein